MNKSELKAVIENLEKDKMALSSTIETQAHIIRNRNNELEEYKASSNTAWYIVRTLTAKIKRMVTILMLDTIMYRTHRERNENVRDTVREIVRLIEKDTGDWTTESQIEKSDMDEIPF